MRLLIHILEKGWKINLFLALQFSGGSKKSIWSMTREQINYYTTQFFCLQSDPNGVIPGTEAKEFFERSKLPINDLRKIWQLSDVSQVLLFSIYWTESFTSLKADLFQHINRVSLSKCLNGTYLWKKNCSVKTYRYTFIIPKWEK